MATSDQAQPVGFAIDDWTPPPFPPGDVLRGRTVTLEPLLPDRHGPQLWEALNTAPESTWTYMTFGPFAGYEYFEEMLSTLIEPDDWLPYAILVDDVPLGFAAYLRISPAVGVIEVGSIVFSAALQRTTEATESFYLMIRHVFDLGYRRCEWKCDSLNEPSRRAAVRLGFTYEGTFRQATHYKGRNRDTAWYAIVDREWPALAAVFTRWLEPENFDRDSQQIATIEEMREA